MSIFTSKTSILKHYAAQNRDKIKQAANNKVRFELLKEKCLRKLIENVEYDNNVNDYHEYMAMIKDADISEIDFISALQESRNCIELLKPKYEELVNALISLDWPQQRDTTVIEYQKFLIDLLSAHNKYTKFAIKKLVSYLVPNESDQFLWKFGIPSEPVKVGLGHVHETIAAILDVIPLSQNFLIDALDTSFPYYERSSYIYSGYVYNIFWLIEYRPSSREELLPLLIK